MSPPIDRDLLCEAIDEQAEVLDAMTAAFEPEATARLADLQAALADCDAAGVARAAHRLRGSLAGFYALPAMSAAEMLEESGLSGDLSEAAEALAALVSELKRLRSELHRVREELEA